MNRLRSALGLAGGMLSLVALADDGRAREEASGVIVTARRAEEPLLAVPISVVRLNRDELKRLGADSLADVAGAAPSLITPTIGVFGAEQPSIRGIFSPIGASTVGLYVDDVPVQIRSLEVAGNPDLRMFDLERIEVLRGPQGSLFGGSSMGGAIRYLTRQPALEGQEGEVSGELAATRGGGITRATQGAWGGAILPGKFGIRASAYYRHDAGLVDRMDPAPGTRVSKDVDHQEVIALRIAGKAAIGEQLSLTPALFVQKGKRADLPFFEDRLGRFRQSALVPQRGRDMFLLPSLTASWEARAATLTSVTAFLNRENRQAVDYSGYFGEIVLGGAVPDIRTPGGSRSLTAVDQRSLTQELRLASSDPARAVSWVIGGFYRRAHLRMEQRVVEPGIAQLANDYLGMSVEDLFGQPLLAGGESYHSRQRIREEELALFGQAVWAPDPRIELAAGLRLTRSRLRFRLFSEGPFAGGRNSIGPRRQSDAPITPYASLSYKIDDARLVYMSAGKGFRAGGTNGAVAAACAADLDAMGRADAPASYGSDSLWSYEAGVKWGGGTDSLQLSLALFRIDWRNIQQSVSLPDCGFSYVDNLGVARNQGFELGIDARPLPPLQLGLSLAFVDARFRRNIGPARADDRGSIVAAGDRVPFVPRWSGRISAEYAFTWPGAMQGFVRAEWQHAGRYRRAPSPLSVSHDPRVYAGEAADRAMLRIGAGRANWGISAFVDNLLDGRALLYRNGELAPVTGSPVRQMPQRPRTVGLNGTLGF